MGVWVAVRGGAREQGVFSCGERGRITMTRRP
jgi:hypothetical protein